MKLPVTFSVPGFLLLFISSLLCVKCVHIWSYSGQHFPAFGLNTEKYSPSLRIQSKCRKIRTRIITKTDTFYAVLLHEKNWYYEWLSYVKRWKHESENITNYRPVFILPCVFNVLERVMYNWLYKYLFEEKLLHSKQPV